MPAEPLFLVGKVEMDVECRAIGPILIEVENVRVFVADMEVVLDAARLCARARDETFEQFDQFGASVRSQQLRVETLL